jgi:hypothetical protein
MPIFFIQSGSSNGNVNAFPKSITSSFYRIKNKNLNTT